jgi:autotransporter-associated beta strand protein
VDTATFDGTGTTATINLDAATPSIKNLNFSGATAYTIAQGTGSNSLTMKSDTPSAAITASTNGHTISAPIVLASNTTASVSGANILTASGAISGSANLTKADTGTLTVTGTGNGGFTGTTTVNNGTLEVTGSLSGTNAVSANSGGVLLLNSSTNASDIVNTAATVNMNSGTLKFAPVKNGISQSFTTLTLSGNSGVDFGSTNGALNGNNFLFSSLSLGGFNLDVRNWSGSLYNLTDTSDPNTDATQDRLRFSIDPGFAPNTLITSINFYDNTNAFLGNGMQVAYGGGGFEIVPVPEPTTSALLGSVAICALFRYRSRRRATRRASVN